MGGNHFEESVIIHFLDAFKIADEFPALPVHRCLELRNGARHVATQHGLLQHSTACCNGALHVATQHSMLQHSTACCNTAQQSRFRTLPSADDRGRSAPF
jgi:hypothetical protein